MRNWNFDTLIRFARGCGFSFYLWGIETLQSEKVRKGFIKSFHSTYEELKLTIWFFIKPIFRSFHSTYEELKPPDAVIPACQMYCFHSTYEELKHWRCRPGCYYPKVFILPMRNWNFVFSRNRYIHLSVFILPMRNWNCFLWRWRKNISCVFILPMRNWN